MRLCEPWSIIVISGVVVLSLIGFFSHKVIKTPHHTEKEEFIGHDNIIEEFVEALIERIFGMSPNSLDFTPVSKEQVAENAPDLSERALETVLEYLSSHGLLLDE